MLHSAEVLASESGEHRSLQGLHHVVVSVASFLASCCKTAPVLLCWTMVSNAHKLAVSKTEVHWQLGCLHAVRMTTAFLACRCRRRIWGEGTGGTVCPLSAEAEQMGVMPLRGAHACRVLGTRLAAGEVRLPCPVACGVQSQPFPLALPMSDAAAMPLCLDRGEGASVSHMGWAPLAGPRVPHKVYACACRWTAPSQHCPPAAGVPAVAGRAAGWTCWPVVMQ